MKRYGLLLTLVLILSACVGVSTPASAPPPAQEEAAPLPATADPGAVSATADGRAPAAELAAELAATFADPVQASGDVLILYGQLLDVNGAPVPDAAVEIWQTDASGVYDHPGDPGTATRDPSFQFYGTATADAEGRYAFRTILPGKYEPRPRHIHFKVKRAGNTLLTSQFYFSDDIAAVQEEGMFRAVGEGGDQLLLQLVQGNGVLLTNGQIVLDTGIGEGTLSLTPSQGEGPYYPVVPLAEYDNDLTVLP